MAPAVQSLCFVLFVWIAFGVIGGLVGGTRGRPNAGVVLGLFLGPLGWLLAMFLPGPLVAPRQKIKIQCSECHGELPDNTVILLSNLD